MKRKIAARKLKRVCTCCNQAFVKGNVYYVNRKVVEEDGELFAYEYLLCPKCQYQTSRQQERYQRFIQSNTCPHPITFEVWQTMVGEYYAKEPSYTECCICKKVL